MVKREEFVKKKKENLAILVQKILSKNKFSAKYNFTEQIKSRTSLIIFKHVVLV